MKMIVAADSNWGIGKDNRLLISIPADMKFFRQTTRGHVVVCGRKTLESFPGGRPLPDRTNIILSSNQSFGAKGAQVVHSLQELLEELKQYDPDEVCCIGGASLYRELLPYTDLVHVTRIDHAYDADTYFPNLDEDPQWELTGRSDEQVYFDLTYHFCRYERRK